MDNYLTEEKLGRVLTELFPNKTIRHQAKFFRKTIDYEIRTNFEDMPHSMIEILKLDEVLKRIVKDNEEQKLPCYAENTELLLHIEYDGPDHYKYPKNVLRDFKFPSNAKIGWVNHHDVGFVLRIPYWLQLDTTMTKLLFGIEKDFSDNYPQGFISKYCSLPSSFCSLGDKRFLSEVKSLPSVVSTGVINSLDEKIKTLKDKRLVIGTVSDILIKERAISDEIALLKI